MSVINALLFLSFYIIQTATQYVTPDGCYRIFPSSSLQCARAFDITTGVTEAACLDRCRLNPNCLTVVYKTAISQCHMFAVGAASGKRRKRRSGKRHRHQGGNNGRGYYVSGNQCGYGGPRITPCPGVNLYQWTGNCPRGSVVTTFAPLPSDVTCPPGQVVRYLRLENTELSGSDTFVFSASSEQVCLDACTNNRLPDGVQAPCRSFDYSFSNGRCAISTDAVTPAGSGFAQSKFGTDYYEKTCFDANTVSQCPEVFTQVPQHVLAGFAQHVDDVATYEQCIELCLNAQAQLGFVCKSGMFYFEENQLNCILNTETRDTQPDLFVEETLPGVGQLNYFETNCFGRARAANELRVHRFNLLDQSNRKRIWSEWSYCNERTGTRRRFRECESMNANSCKMQTQPCREAARKATPQKINVNQAEIQTINLGCQPLLKVNGSPDCSIPGIMIIENKRLGCHPDQCQAQRRTTMIPDHPWLAKQGLG